MNIPPGVFKSLLGLSLVDRIIGEPPAVASR